MTGFSGFGVGVCVTGVGLGVPPLEGGLLTGDGFGEDGLPQFQSHDLLRLLVQDLLKLPDTVFDLSLLMLPDQDIEKEPDLDLSPACEPDHEPDDETEPLHDLEPDQDFDDEKDFEDEKDLDEE